MWFLDDKGYCVIGKKPNGAVIHAHRVQADAAGPARSTLGPMRTPSTSELGQPVVPAPRTDELYGRCLGSEALLALLLVCRRCGHPEEMHPRHEACRFHLCDCPTFLSTDKLEGR